MSKFEVVHRTGMIISCQFSTDRCRNHWSMNYWITSLQYQRCSTGKWHQDQKFKCGNNRLVASFLQNGGGDHVTAHSTQIWVGQQRRRRGSSWTKGGPLLVPQVHGNILVWPHSFFVLSPGKLVILHFNPDVKRPHLWKDFSLLLLWPHFFQFSSISPGFVTLYVISSQIWSYYDLKWSICYSEPPSLPL